MLDVDALTAIAAKAYDDVLDGKLPHLNPLQAVVEAILAALPSGAEPVAWQWKYRGDPQDAEWWRTPSPADLEYVRSRPDKYELRGLYASPQSSSQVTEDAVDKLHAAMTRSFQTEPWIHGPPKDTVRRALTAALYPVKGDGQ